MRRIEQTFRLEPDAQLIGITPAMRAALYDLNFGALCRWNKGFSLAGPDGFPAGKTHRTQTIDALLDRGLITKFVIIGSGGKRIQTRVTGLGAWYCRTIRRQASNVFSPAIEAAES